MQDVLTLVGVLAFEAMLVVTWVYARRAVRFGNQFWKLFGLRGADEASAARLGRVALVFIGIVVAASYIASLVEG